jgi:hypothetical protein
MPSNSSGWFWHCLARETGKVGHLYSPDAQRGPWPWFPFALDNGAFSCWDQKNNSFNENKWSKQAWIRLIVWASSQAQKPLWAIVPDRPGCAEQTFLKWQEYVGAVKQNGIAAALAVQDGMTPRDVCKLDTQPDVIAVGGSTEWKWETVEMWAKSFKRVHLLRCNSPSKLDFLEEIGIESCDGTGWNRGDATQTSGLERFLRKNPLPKMQDLHPFVCKQPKQKNQLIFA